MTKKIVMLFFLLVILTGCTAQVNIKITDGVIKEDITIDSYPTAKISSDTIRNGFRKNVPAFKSEKLIDSEPDTPKTGVNYYKYSMSELPNNGYRTNYNYDFDMSNYRDSRALNDAFVKNSITTMNGEYVIKTEAPNQYLSLYRDLDKLVISIVSDYEILENNADSCEGNKCEWTYSKDNNKKGIYLKLNVLDKKDEKSSENSKKKKSNLIILLIITIVVGFIVLKFMSSKKLNK